MFGKKKQASKEQGRSSQPPVCGERAGASHECARPADGHTMHTCARGDCRWGY